MLCSRGGRSLDIHCSRGGRGQIRRPKWTARIGTPLEHIMGQSICLQPSASGNDELIFGKRAIL